MKKFSLLILMFTAACAGVDTDLDAVDEQDECVFCDDRADAYGISRSSYLAYGIVHLANNAREQVLDVDVALDARAARGIVANRPFAFVEEIDAVPYVGRAAFSKMAAYVQTHNLMPYCGDGIIQSLIETCDDGNTVDGDGCSSTCQVDATNHAVLASQPELISGAEIDVPQVDPQSFYFRSRIYKRQYTNMELTFLASPELLSLLRRADSIQAGNGEDGVVGWDDLAILSKSPFYDVLLPAEKVALDHAWEMFKISDAPIVEMAYTGPSISNTIPMQVDIVRPGPLVVPRSRLISELDYRVIAQRIQGVPALNSDGDPATVHFEDVLMAREHYQPIFTSSESSQLEGLYEEFFEGANPQHGGEFTVEFEAAPDLGPVTHPIISFDGWDFGYETLHTVRYTAEDAANRYWPSAQGSLVQEYSRRTTLTRHGESKLDCEAGPFSYCDTKFRYTGVRFYKLDGVVVSPGESTGLRVMELWENGLRTYNRVVDFKHKMHGVAPWPKKFNEYFMGVPQFGQQPLSLQKDGTTFALSTAPGLTPGVDTMLPDYIARVRSRLPAGRYEEFEGVVLDVHESGAVVAHFDGCEFPTRIFHNYLNTDTCPASGRKVRLYFADYKTTLYVYGEGDQAGKSVEIDDRYDSSLIHGYIRRDRSYHVTR